MKRIIYHWTGGVYLPNFLEKKCYHFLIDDKGLVYNGKFLPEDNKKCIEGQYAAHTGGGNTSAIGVAFCGMYGFVDRNNIGNYPLTKKQCESGFELGAILAKKYKLNLNNSLSIQTHYGFGKRNYFTSSHGKIDIIFLPPYADVLKDDVEKFIREKVKWYYLKYGF